MRALAQLFHRGGTLVIALALATSILSVSAEAERLERPCPFSCKEIPQSSDSCRDWRIGTRCFVETTRLTSATWIMCMRLSDGSLRARKGCKTDGSEIPLSAELLKGGSGTQGPRGDRGDVGERGPQGDTGPAGVPGIPGAVGASGPTGGTGATGATGAIGATGATGPQGATGATGANGIAGADGTLRVFGDGSAGARVFSSSVVFADDNSQYTDVTINSGVTVTMPSGVVLRASGTFTNNGTIEVTPGLRDAPKFGENGRILGAAGSTGQESAGGAGGIGLSAGVAKGLLRLSILSAGNGYREASDNGGDGGGSFTVIARGALVNNGVIAARGAPASGAFRGGGGGGFVVLASLLSVSNPGSITVVGGDGGGLEANDSNNTGRGPGGGGGGGIAHLIAPTIITSGSIDVSGGSGGAGGGAGTITGLIYFGGGGGGGSGGSGGNGGAVNPGNSNNGACSSASSGVAGLILQTLADPAALL